MPTRASFLYDSSGFFAARSGGFIYHNKSQRHSFLQLLTHVCHVQKKPQAEADYHGIPHSVIYEQWKVSSRLSGHDERISDCIPTLSTRRSIRTWSPKLKTCIAHVRNWAKPSSGRILRYDNYVNNSIRASEDCAYDLNSLPRDRVGLGE